MEAFRAALTEEPRAPYLKPFVIVAPSGSVKVYGSPYIVFHRLDIPTYTDYFTAPYITLTIPFVNLRSFKWFWFYLNGLEMTDDPYWKTLSLEERLGMWVYLGGLSPDHPIKGWYVNHLFDDITPSPDMADHIPILNDIGSKVSLRYRVTGPATTMRLTRLAHISPERDDHLPIEKKLLTIGSFDMAIATISGNRPFGLPSVVPGLGTVMTVRSVIINRKLYSPTKVGAHKDVIHPRQMFDAGADIEYVFKLGSGMMLALVDNVWYITSNYTITRLTSVEFYSTYEHPGVIQPIPGSIIHLVGKGTFPVKVGDLVLHGDLHTMKSRSNLVREAYNLPGEPTFLQGQSLGDDFIYVWSYLQGIPPSAKATPRMWYYIDYFGIPLDTVFVNDYIRSLLGGIRTVEEYDWIVSLINSIPLPIRMGYSIMEEDYEGIAEADTLLHRRPGFKRDPITINSRYSDYRPIPHSEARNGDLVVVWIDRGGVFVADYAFLQNGTILVGNDHILTSYDNVWVPSRKRDGSLELGRVGFMRSSKPRRFRYKNLMRREYNNTDRVVSMVVFEYAFSPEHRFMSWGPLSPLMTESEAIAMIEEWFSAPADERHFLSTNMGVPWSRMSKVLVIRGDYISNSDRPIAIVATGIRDGVLRLNTPQYL